MSKKANLIGAVALGAAAITAFVVVQTAGKPAAPAGFVAFAADVSPDNVTVTCGPGESTTTADVQVMITGGEGNLGGGRRVVATWDGGSRVITQFDRSYQADPGSIPCPLDGDPTTLEFTFQQYKGSTLLGEPVVASTMFQRVGPPS